MLPGLPRRTLMLPFTSLLRRVPSLGARLRLATALPARTFTIAAAEPRRHRRRRAVPLHRLSFSRCASGASSPPPPSLPGEPRAAPSKPDYKGDAQRFIEERGYEARVAKGVVDTLLQPGMGVTPGTLMGTVERLAGHFDIDLDAGLEALAKAVEQELMKVEGKALVSIVVQPAVGEAFTAKAYEGMNLKEMCEHGTDGGAQLLGEYIECACDGLMACSTCHVVVDPAWIGRVGHPGESEMDMLDLAFEPTDTSRLGCQITLTPALEGLRVRLPGGANNLFDHIPFE